MVCRESRLVPFPMWAPAVPGLPVGQCLVPFAVLRDRFLPLARLARPPGAGFAYAIVVSVAVRGGEPGERVVHLRRVRERHVLVRARVELDQQPVGEGLARQRHGLADAVDADRRVVGPAGLSCSRHRPAATALPSCGCGRSGRSASWSRRPRRPLSAFNSSLLLRSRPFSSRSVSSSACSRSRSVVSASIAAGSASACFPAGGFPPRQQARLRVPLSPPPAPVWRAPCAPATRPSASGSPPLPPGALQTVRALPGGRPPAAANGR